MRVTRSAAAATLAALALASGSARAESTVFLTIDSLSRSEVVRGDTRLGFVSGRALAAEGALPQFDVLFLVDVSGSTAQSAGVDVDGDGRISGGGGRRGLFGGRKTGADSILAAELAAVESLVSTFDPRTTRVGVVSFSGGDHPGGDSAMVDVPLTSSYARVRAGLREIQLSGPDGWTNLYAGLRIARGEVSGGRESESKPRPGAQRHVVLLTDGYPLVPYESPERSAGRAIKLAERMGRERIRVDTYAIGPDATDQPRAALRVARASGGRFTAVRDPRDLERLLGEASFASIDEVRVRNVDTDGAADQVIRNADGSYSALVPLRPGENTIEVWARSTDGVEKTVRRTGIFSDQSLAQREQADLARLIAKSRSRRVEGEVTIEVESRPEP